MTERTRAQLSEILADRYHLEDEIGRGGMAVVFRAHDARHGRAVAVKALYPQRGDEAVEERFLQEIQLVAGLQHPHILPLYDSGAADDLLYYVMPLVEGESLRDRLAREGQMALADVLTIARGVAAALDFAHARGVLHRDIKPENIMLHAGGPMVADFGIARLIGPTADRHLTATGLLVGTPHYMSPEQASGERALDGRSDQFSLAVVIYEMVTGTTPYQGPTDLAVIVRRITDVAPPPSLLRANLPAGAERAILRALARTPEQRFDTVTSFVDGLAQGAEGAVAASGGLPTPSLAVLPFTNSSADPGNEYFSDGITEEIINVLARSPNLRVAARTSVFAFKHQAQDVREIGRRLGVGAVLEGSVRKSGERVRITAQLVDARDGLQRWSGQYDRQLDDAFAVQEDIAQAIAGVLETTLASGRGGPAAARATPTGGPSAADGMPLEPLRPSRPRDPQAFELYLKGRHQANRRTETGLHQAATFLAAALARDAGDANTNVALAEVHLLLGIYGAADPEEVMPLAEREARAALALDGSLAEARAVIAAVRAAYHWDWPGAEREFRAGLELAPRFPTTHLWYATMLLMPRGRWEEAGAALAAATALDPLSGAVNASRGLLHFLARRYERAVGELTSTLERDPRFALAHFFLGQVYDAMGRADDAVRSHETAIAESGGSAEMTAALAHALARAGRPAEAEARLAELERWRASRYVSPTLVAQVQAGLGRHDNALAELEAAHHGRAADLLWLNVRPAFDPLRGEARFAAILERMGLA